jgi:hypothetical protein
MTEDRRMTVAKLIDHLGRFPAEAEVVELDLSVLVDADVNLVQSLSLWEKDEDEDDEPDDPEREEIPTGSDRKVVDLSPRRSKP